MADKAGGLSALTTLARFAVPKLVGGIGGRPVPEDGLAEIEAINTAFSSLPESFVAARTLVDVPADSEGWITTDISVSEGDELTFFAGGTVWMSRPLDIRVNASMGLWFRIGDGPARKIPAAPVSFSASEEGALSFVAKPPGEFASPDGAFDPEYSRKGTEGGFAVCAAKWSGSAMAGLMNLQGLVDGERGQAMVSEALVRRTAPKPAPEGWHYLWRLGDDEIYHKEETAQGGCIHCDTNEDVGILQIPAERPLTNNLTLDWEWIAHELPSRLPEHIEPTHDYLSIAVEFENGLDLTYMWSAALPEDTIFQCPLAYWDKRETHWVIRTAKDVGKWLPESRSIKADYEKAIGGPVPEKVVQVWLIANSVFQRGRGRCDYRAIRLVDGDETLTLT